MSLDTTQKLINKAKADVKKHEQVLEKKLAKILASSGIMDLNMPEKDLKKALKHFVDQIKKNATQPPKE